MISIVIPVYNEARIVREAAVELCRKLDELGWRYELILAENGSRDGTLRILEELAAGVPGVRWLHEEEPNYGRALKRGILEARGKIVICDEIDLCDTEFYQRALPLLEQGADLVVGSKAMKGANDARRPGSGGPIRTASRHSSASGWSTSPAPASSTATSSPASS